VSAISGKPAAARLPVNEGPCEATGGLSATRSKPSLYACRWTCRALGSTEPRAGSPLRYAGQHRNDAAGRAGSRARRGLGAGLGVHVEHARGSEQAILNNGHLHRSRLQGFIFWEVTGSAGAEGLKSGAAQVLPRECNRTERILLFRLISIR
jgi:hypothetical protein